MVGQPSPSTKKKHTTLSSSYPHTIYGQFQAVSLHSFPGFLGVGLMIRIKAKFGFDLTNLLD